MYSELYDKLALANWIALIADDRGLDAAYVAALAGIDGRSAQAILDGEVAGFSVRTLDDVLRAVERLPALPREAGPCRPYPTHAGAAAALP